MKTKIKDVFNISEAVSFVNVDIEGDVRVFIDPSFLENNLEVQNFDAKIAHQKVNSFFSIMLNYYRDGKKNEAVKMFTNSSEINAIGFGYSRNNRNGKGLSKEQVESFFDDLYSMKNLNDELLTNPSMFRIFMTGFDKDRFTDLLLPIFLKELNDYSLAEAKKYGLSVTNEKIEIGKFWNGKKFEVLEEKSVIYQGSLIVLVPFSICVTNYSATIERFVGQIIFPSKQNKYEDKMGSKITKKELKDDIRGNDDQDGYLKRYALNEIRENPDYIERYFEYMNMRGTKTRGTALTSDSDY